MTTHLILLLFWGVPVLINLLIYMYKNETDHDFDGWDKRGIIAALCPLTSVLVSVLVICVVLEEDIIKRYGLDNRIVQWRKKRKERKRERERERIRLKYLHIDPYGEDNWDEN